jgi:hypothetical protein
LDTRRTALRAETFVCVFRVVFEFFSQSMHMYIFDAHVESIDKIDILP